jgi:hypothetical protein
MRNIWLLTFVLLFLQCSIKDRQASQEVRYEAMRKRVLADSTFVAIVDEKAASGDTTMIGLKNAIQLSHKELINLPGVDSLQVENMISALYISLDVVGKFDNIENQLENSIEESKAQYSAEELKEMEAQKKAAVDSLRSKGILPKKEN